ncbi:hypothetical protein QTO34_003971 [Cnephaeus nilssonii]|uniref:Butyrophilin subfamily 3 member A2-like Ig-C domain-containing protein n=1 Tax=Cnephaeus nilssonii TaxID=3371016 RepID=A0AA40HRL7_CNENI|nr:hypothetical protein QTO34_003971 [Eptesicus nilssonii]
MGWTQSLPSQVMRLYWDGRDKSEKAMEDRAVKNVMHKGIEVLRLLNVLPSDSEQYHCAFKHGSFYSDTVIELKGTDLSSHPQFHMDTKSRQLQLVCKSEGWFPQPKVQ